MAKKRPRMEIGEGLRAGFWERAGSLFIDGCVLVPLMLAVKFYDQPAVVLICYAVMIFYKPLMEYFFGATLGKITFHLRVTSDRMRYVGFVQSVSRNLAWWLSLLVGLWYHLSPPEHRATLMPYLIAMTLVTLLQICLAISLLASQEGRAWHDYWARTRVFQA